MRTFLRLFGALFFLWALGAFGYEIYLMVQTGAYRMVSLAELWTVAHRPSIDLLRTWLDSGTWNVLLATYFGWPGWAALAVPASVLVILSLGGRRDDTVLRELPGR